VATITYKSCDDQSLSESVTMHVNKGCMLSLGFVDSLAIYVVIYNYGKFKISVAISK